MCSKASIVIPSTTWRALSNGTIRLYAVQTMVLRIPKTALFTTNSTTASPRNLFRTFDSCSKYNLKSSIQLYDKIDRIQDDLSENIYIKYQIIKASSVSTYPWKICFEKFSEKFVSL
jgi:hypothetical protein